MIDPGALNRRLVLEQPVETPDGAGGVARTYGEVAELWAEVRPLRDRPAEQAGAAGADLTYRITVRAGPDIGLRHRLRDGARVFRIVAVRPAAPTDPFLHILAEERAE